MAFSCPKIALMVALGRFCMSVRTGCVRLEVKAEGTVDWCRVHAPWVGGGAREQAFRDVCCLVDGV